MLVVHEVMLVVHEGQMLVVRILGKHEGRILLREPQFALSHYLGLPVVS